MKDFTKEVIGIAVPVALQSLLASSFSIVDQLMIGSLGADAIASIGICGNVWLIFNVVLGVVATVAGIMISQFIGAKEEKEVWSSLNVNLLITVIIAVLTTWVARKMPHAVISLYTKDDSVLALGADYLMITSLGIIMLGVSTILSTYLRCREHANIPLIVSFAGIILNTALNYCLIYGKAFMPQLGVKGAAIATVLSETLTLILTLSGFIYSLKKDKVRPVFTLILKKISKLEYLKMMAPILLSEVGWGISQAIYSATFGNMGVDDLAGYTITYPIQGMICGILSGFSAAAAIIVGKKLGAKEYDEAYRTSKEIMKLGMMGSVIFAVLLIILSDAYVSLYSCNTVIHSVARSMLMVFAIYTPVKVANMIVGGGILKSGGNTYFVMAIDMFGTWLVGVPLCLITAKVLSLDIVTVYAIFSVEELVRLILSIIVFRGKKWMKTLGLG
ncbi:MAG: MATE family efflux transporter [Pseudobutyrivibrio sp.]|nr:MATE family efflux transporter [Pseudobutyrivibrio sp.]